jgi:two-component system chemotaxis sensor kinase CheA
VDRKKYQKIFIEEARAHLAELDAEAVALEAAPDAGLADSLFRHAHSIKGMAASMGYEPVVEVAHALEDLLSSFRDGGHTADRTLVDLLLAAGDRLSQLVDAVERADELPAAADLSLRIRNYLRGAPAEPALAAVATADAPAPESGLALAITFSPLAVLPAARAFQVCKALQDVAVSFDPPLEQIRAGKFGGELRAYLAAAPDEALLARIRAVPDVDKVAYAEVQAAVSAERPAAGKARIDLGAHVRMDMAVLDRFVDMVGELVTVNNQIRETSRGLFSAELQTTVDALGRITGGLYQEVLQARMVPFSLLAERLPRVVRDVAQQLGKQVQLVVQGNDVELDRSVIEHLSDPLVHLVRNAVDHGFETPAERHAAGKAPAGKLVVRARQAESQVVVEIQDDGRGIDRDKVLAHAVAKGLVTPEAAAKLGDGEVYDFLFHAGFSTAGQVSNISGRGVGLDVVQTALETLGGEIELQSKPGQGTTFRLRLPARVAIIPVFLVRAGEQTFGLPISKVSRARWIKRTDIQLVGGRESLLVDGVAVPVHNLARVLGIQESFEETDELTVFEVERAGGQALLAIEAFLEERQVYLKTPPRPLDRLRGIFGLTLVRGEPVFVLDPVNLIWTYA